MIAYALLALVPVALGLDHFGAGPVWVFLTAAAAVAVLADWVRRGTEQMAMHVGPSIGGLLNVSFGSVAELILAVFVLLSGQIQVVQAQITGSIIATSLLGLGLAAFARGIDRAGPAALQPRQRRPALHPARAADDRLGAAGRLRDR